MSIIERGTLAIRQNLLIPRPATPSENSFPERDLGSIEARLYSSLPLKEIKNTDKIIIQVPGGGFVTMNPKCHDDYVSIWSRQLPGIPIVALNYGKAPENPYPWALEEVFDAYRSIVESTRKTRMAIPLEKREIPYKFF